jgi:hypothetical protein
MPRELFLGMLKVIGMPGSWTATQRSYMEQNSRLLGNDLKGEGKGMSEKAGMGRVHVG